MNIFVNTNIIIFSEKCIERCCVANSVPIKCVKEKLETQRKSGYNSTHSLVTLVMSNECQDYEEALTLCKLECTGDTKGKNDIIKKYS